MNELSLVEFADNPEPRCPCILLLDTSGSMSGSPIEQLNQGLKAFKDALEEDSLAARRVEVCIVTYGLDGVHLTQDFITVDDFQPPVLESGGLTPMGQAIELAVAELNQRKRQYKDNAIQYFRPWVFLITDGEPTDSVDAALRAIKSGEANQEFAFFAVGVEDANMKFLNGLSTRGALKLKGLAFRELFQWLSQSLTSVSNSRVGQQVQLEPPGWTMV